MSPPLLQAFIVWMQPTSLMNPHCTCGYSRTKPHDRERYKQTEPAQPCSLRCIITLLRNLCADLEVPDAEPQPHQTTRQCQAR
jgi:hypothetical protein